MNVSTHTQRLMADYTRMAQTIRMRLLDGDHWNAKIIWNTFTEARQEFTALIPRIPFIGEKNIWQFNLNTSAMNLALFRALKKQGFTLLESVQMMDDIFEAYLHSFPRPLQLAYRRYYFSLLHQDRLRRGASASQLCRYPLDWVFTYIDGNGSSFDMGIDISECAILKFYQAQKAEELVPYLCKLDHAIGKWFGLGFTRQSTLADGAPLCDCRWKRGPCL